ncbi:MAG: GNAT family N-acetyltransferase [Pseudomonadota bacterium]
MTRGTLEVFELDAAGLQRHIDDLCRVLIDSVAEGAAISFMAPLATDVAARFWLTEVTAEMAAGRRRLFGASIEGRLVGTVQLIVGMPPNQPHRAEISKMIVHPDNRRQGIAKALMQAALEAAQKISKTLVTLDTRTGDVSEALYESVGFQKAGVIPGFAQDPDGKALHATTYMFKTIGDEQ